MKIFFEIALEEKLTNLGIAKALTETHLSAQDLWMISRYLSVYCEETLFVDHPTEKGGAEE